MRFLSAGWRMRCIFRQIHRYVVYALLLCYYKNMNAYTFRIIIELEKPRGYHGFVPILRGVHTFGDTIEEVKKNLKEAIRCHVQGLLKDREAIPQEGEAFETIQSFSEREFALSR